MDNTSTNSSESDFIGFQENVDDSEQSNPNFETSLIEQDFSCQQEIIENMEHPAESSQQRTNQTVHSPVEVMGGSDQILQLLLSIQQKTEQNSQEMANKIEQLQQGQQEIKQEISQVKDEILTQVRQELVNTEAKLKKVQTEVNEKIYNCTQRVEKCELVIDNLQTGLDSCNGEMGSVKESVGIIKHNIQEHGEKISALQENISQVQISMDRDHNELIEVHGKANENARGILLNEREIEDIKSKFEVNVEKVLMENRRIGNQFEKFRDEVGQECLKKVEEKLGKIRGNSSGGIRSTVLTVDEVNIFEKSVPKFYGDDRGATPIQFITKCEKVFGYLKGSDEQQVELFVSKLAGDALQWGMQK
ncbi:uncharacterized protein PF3D7_1120000-like [Bacillus rossius redtenbacheri]|uniref:uncharacterized protein PF3D7_1120000-like n=1 Tax=Bacillus rossius redtenbacheri TaxID=93214 RepID=UPI002FDE65CE